MSYYTDKNDYTPKFRVGDVVTVNGFASDRNRQVTVTGRKVTRTNRHCDTYYTLSDGTGAYEWSVEHTTYRRSPGNWADNIANRFAACGHPYTLSVEGGHANLWLTGPKGVARIIARLQDDGNVESIGSHSVIITFEDGTEKGGAYDNLGEVIVAVSNNLL